MYKLDEIWEITEKESTYLKLYFKSYKKSKLGQILFLNKHRKENGSVINMLSNKEYVLHEKTPSFRTATVRLSRRRAISIG